MCIRDSKSLIKENRFREDLYYRLAEIVVNIPPLRARQGDAALLAHAFVRRFSEEQKRGTMTVSYTHLDVYKRQVVVYAVIFALIMVVFNSWLGLYSRTHTRTISQTRARAVLSLYLSVPLAYGVFSFLSIADDNQRLLLLSGLVALFGTLAHRVYTMHLSLIHI